MYSALASEAARTLKKYIKIEFGVVYKYLCYSAGLFHQLYSITSCVLVVVLCSTGVVLCSTE